MALDHLINDSATHLRRGFDYSDTQFSEYSWKKAKRSKLSRRDHDELDEAATWLVNLATTATDKESSSPATSLKIADYYTCTVCSKAFPTYQALGGHKSSHRVKPPPSAAVDDVIDELRVFCHKASGKKLHECKICHKNFPTGQALGGHKRKHFDGVIGGASAKSRSAKSGVTCDGGAGSLTSGAVVREFDLNLPPPGDDEVESSMPPLFG